MQIVNKHSPIRRHWVNGQENPWFSPELADTMSISWLGPRQEKQALLVCFQAAKK